MCLQRAGFGWVAVALGCCRCVDVCVYIQVIPSSPMGVASTSDVLGGSEVDPLGRWEAGVVTGAIWVWRQVMVRGCAGVHGCGCCKVHSCTINWGTVRMLIVL